MFSPEQILEFKQIARYILRNLHKYSINLNDQHVTFLNKFANSKTSITDQQITYFLVIKDKIVIQHVKQQIKALEDFISNIESKL